jgi:hypothetical protein
VDETYLFMFIFCERLRLLEREEDWASRLGRREAGFVLSVAFEDGQSYW